MARDRALGGSSPFHDSDLGRGPGRPVVRRESWFAEFAGAAAESTRPSSLDDLLAAPTGRAAKRAAERARAPAAPEALPDTVPAETWVALEPRAPAPVEATRPADSDYSAPPVIEPQPLPATGERKGPPRAFRRIFRGLVVARALLGVLLLVMQGLVTVYASVGPAPGVLAVGGIYALACLFVLVLVEWWRLPQLGRPMNAQGQLNRRWTLATVGVDLLCFGALLLALPPAPLNVSALLLLPVITAGTLLPRRSAVAVAAAAVLILLAGAWWRVLGGSDMTAQLSQAGMFGAMIFALSLLTAELTDRLVRQEAAARSTMELARQQALLNRLMIEEMQDGVMVVDRQGHVRAANPAALSLIGAPQARRFVAFDLQQHEAWQPLWLALERAQSTGVWPEGGEEIRLRLTEGDKVEERGLRLRLRFTRHQEGGAAEALCVLFMEDVRVTQARARQEKLAAMGRVSAGIAHEIRNPLAAIAQANALLGEDLLQPAQRQLSRMVADNVVRLQRIVDDVMEAAPGAPREAPVIDLSAQVRALTEEWSRTASLPQIGPSPLMVDTSEGVLPVRFDPDHLRRVLVNLLDNALRHGSGRADALWVRVHARGDSQVLLSVASDGAPIPPDVEPYLFEPFFSTRSRGSGLGLYICRELCERYGARIEYHLRGPGARHRNVFVLTLPRMVPVAPGGWPPAARAR